MWLWVWRTVVGVFWLSSNELHLWPTFQETNGIHEDYHNLNGQLRLEMISTQFVRLKKLRLSKFSPFHFPGLGSKYKNIIRRSDSHSNTLTTVEQTTQA